MTNFLKLPNDILGDITSFINVSQLYNLSQMSDNIQQIIYERYPPTEITISNIEEGRKYKKLFKNAQFRIENINEFTDEHLKELHNIVYIDIGCKGYTLVLPNISSNGQVLVSDGSGQLSWGDVQGDPTSDSPIVEQLTIKVPQEPNSICNLTFLGICSLPNLKTLNVCRSHQLITNINNDLCCKCNDLVSGMICQLKNKGINVTKFKHDGTIVE